MFCRIMRHVAFALGVIALSVWSSVAQPTPTLLPESVTSIYAVTEGIGSVPFATWDNYSLSRFINEARTDVARLALLGVRWYRMNSSEYGGFAFSTHRPGPDRYSRQDAFIRLLQEKEIQILGVISPWTGYSSCSQPMERPLEAGYIPADLAAYREYVKQTVERYDMDGKDDMLHMRYPVRYWQVDNAVDSRWFDCREQGREFATVQEYFTILKTTYEAIKEADPKAKVLLGLELLSARPEGLKYLQDLWALGGGQYFDIANYQDFTYDLDNLVARIAQVRALTAKPVWVTAASVPSNPSANFAWNEALHARALVKYYMRTVIESGAEKLFWHSLNQEPAQPDSARWKKLGSNGLFECSNPQTDAVLGVVVCAGREWSPAARTYFLMTSKIQRYVIATPFTAFTVIPVGAVVRAYILDLSVNAAPTRRIVVMWSETGKAIVNMGGGDLTVIVTHIIESPDQTDPLISAVNSTQLEVGPSPIFIEINRVP
ncbi:hypothetical protein LM602_08945 [Candidatus Acetothermia bacterium]|nr:hypothetical protein [Candidatus Acetothermia bacterium]